MTVPSVDKNSVGAKFFDDKNPIMTKSVNNEIGQPVKPMMDFVKDWNSSMANFVNDKNWGMREFANDKNL